jgi:RNase P protein component
MFPPKNRLTVLDFYKNPKIAKRVFLSNLTLFIKDSLIKPPRFTIIVPKSLDKRSSFRHRTKRVIIEAIRPYLKKIKIKKDFLIKAKKILNKKDRKTAEKELLLYFNSDFKIHD